MSVDQSWSELADSIRVAGERLAADSVGLDEWERADGYRALLRALNNQLGRFEVDRDRPELVAFNGWREKYFMDNPDFRYWVADVRAGSRYRITGTAGDAVYQSITAYEGDVGTARAVGRIDSDQITVDADGRFEVVASTERPATGDWLPLEAGATAIWVRHFHDDVAHDRLGDCTIEPLDPPTEPRVASADDMARRLTRLGTAMSVVPKVFAASAAAEADTPNQLRHWAEMSGGAAFTEPGIHYVRGSWQLAPDEALVIEGPVVDSRYWNILLYSRFLNSLDFRSRQVSRTSGNARLVDGRYRFVLAARDPGGDVDWLDTEGRPFGIVVMRWLQPADDVPLPEVRRYTLAELGG